VPHSSDDDDRSYRSREEVEAWKKKDPIVRFQKHLMDEGVLTQAHIDAYEAEIKQTITEAQQQAEAAPFPSIEDGFSGVYAGEVL
jgi:2-oxoisovalerate dehydrogenase E1 component alpha subunit